jgi:hypothetical protein
MLRTPIGSLFQKYGFFMDCPRIAITTQCYAVPHSMIAAQYVLFFLDD